MDAFSFCLPHRTAKRPNHSGVCKPPAGACKLPMPLSASGSLRHFAWQVRFRCAFASGLRAAFPHPRKGRMGRPETQKKENTMTHPIDIPLVELIDDFDFDLNEVRDLVGTTPLRFDDAGLSVGNDADQFFGLDAANLTGRFC
jgi:hypothetical protein